MRKYSAILSLCLFVLFTFLPLQKTYAKATPGFQQIDLATLYWVYFGIPFPKSSGISPTTKVNVPTPIITQAPNAGTSATLTPTPTKPPTLISTRTSLPTATLTPQLTRTTAMDPTETMLMQGINQYRASQGLGPVANDPHTCSFAQTRANEIGNGFNHDGFNNRVSNKTLPYPSYHQVTENIAETQDPNQVVTLWVNSPGHAENMRQDTPYVCVKWSGNFYAYEGWRP